MTLPRIPTSTANDCRPAVTKRTADELIRIANQGRLPDQRFIGDAQWTRLIGKAELKRMADSGLVPASELNPDGSVKELMRCREVVNGAGTEIMASSPSIWLQPCDLNVSHQNYIDLSDPPVLVHFPELRHECDRDERDCMDLQNYLSDRDKFLVFFNRRSGQWESQVGSKGDQFDLVKFCLPLGQPAPEPVELCTGIRNDQCEIQTEPSPDLSRYLFDGVAIRHMPSCSYTCGAIKEGEDVWLLVDNIGDFSGQFDQCHWAKRLDDAYQVETCKALTLTGASTFTFNKITETRPVYVMASCGCGCPDTNINLNFFLFKRSSVVPGSPLVQVACDVLEPTIDVEIIQTGIDGGSGNKTYRGGFCLTEDVPIILSVHDYTNPNPAGPDLVYLQHDCLTGEPVAAFFDSGDIEPSSGGCCMVPTSLSLIDFADLTFRGYFDGLWLWAAGDNCTPQRQTCEFCYTFTFECTPAGTITNFILKQAFPAGHPIYGGTGSGDPNSSQFDEVDGGNLYSFGDNILGPDTNECPSRYWMSFNAAFPTDGKSLLGNVDVPGNPTPQDFQSQFPDDTTQWPHLYYHVFGCCQGPFVTASQAQTSCRERANLISCMCCPDISQPCDEDVSGGDEECGATVLMKLSWACGRGD